MLLNVKTLGRDAPNARLSNDIALTKSLGFMPAAAVNWISSLQPRTASCN
jgi:hypothetical protein